VLYERGEIRRGRAGEANVLASRGVEKSQRLGVQAEAHRLCGCAVAGIADDWVSKRGQVRADLMAHPSRESNPD